MSRDEIYLRHIPGLVPSWPESTRLTRSAAIVQVTKGGPFETED